MERFFRSRKILKPDVPPITTGGSRYGVVLLAGIGLLCAGGIVAAIILVILKV